VSTLPPPRYVWTADGHLYAEGEVPKGAVVEQECRVGDAAWRQAGGDGPGAGTPRAREAETHQQAGAELF
jgi:hypothetical protein